MAKIGSQDGIVAAVNRLRDLDPAGTLLVKTSGKWPDITTLPSDLSQWKAWDKLQRTLQILKADHDGGGGVPDPSPPQTTPPQGSVFSGKGAFTTSEPAALNGLNADWVALQADPEGSLSGYTGAARVCYWQARGTQPIVDQAKQLGIPYIGQAENQDELDKCLALNTDGLVAKALVGNAGSWTPEGAQKANAQGWDLIQEWYKNAHPWEASPDANNYPHFVNVCFGIYSEGDPGGDGHVPNNVRLSDYLSVWHGSYSVWRAEAMTEADRSVFNS